MHPTIAIIGAGKVGTAIGTLLHDAGYRIRGVVCRSKSSASRAVSVMGAGVPLASVNQAVKDAEWIFMTVPDDALDEVAKEVRKHIDRRTQLLIHTSGVHGATILAGPETDHVRCLSMHPIQSVADLETGADRLKGAFWGLEGHKDAVEIGKRLVADMGGRPLALQEGRKALYHAAAVMSSNYIVALIHVGLRLMEAAGMDQRDALQAISILASGALSNVKEKGVATSLTGPIERGDVRTVRAHLSELNLLEQTIESLYRTLGLYTVEIAREKHADRFDEKFDEQLGIIERTLHRID